MIRSFIGKRERPLLRLAASLWALAVVLAPCSAQAALAVSKSIAPTYANPIFPGDVTAFRITLSNSNAASAVTGVAFTDTFPSGLKVAGIGLRAYTCTDGDGVVTPGAGAVTATVGGGSIILAGGVIPAAKAGGASGRCDIDVEVTSTVRNSVQTNTIPAGTVTGTDTGSVSNGTPAVQTLTVNNLNLPVITKSFGAASIVRADQPTQLTIVISNAGNPSVNLPLNGGGDTPAFALRDILPVGLEVAATPNASSACSGAGVAPAFAPAAGATTVTAVGGTVAAGGTCTLRVDVVGVTSAGSSSGGVFSQALTNTIFRATDFANLRGLTPAANATAVLSVRSALGLAKVFSPGTVAAGRQSTLTITLSNASPVTILHLDAVEALREDQIDGSASATSGLLITAAPSTSCGGTVTANGANEGFTVAGGQIAAGGSCTITIPYTGTLQTPGTPQSFTNDIPEGAVKTDEAITSPRVVASVNVVDQLTVSKTVSPATAAPGNPVRYTITINNFTGGALTNVKVTDTLPAGMLLLASSPAAPALGGAPCSGLSQDPASTAAVPVFVIANFAGSASAAPATCTIIFFAQSPQGAAPGVVLSNSIGPGGVTGTSGGGPVSNAGGSGAANTTVANAITVNKSFNPTTAFEGVISQLTIVFTNITAQPITGGVFTDTLPVGSSGAQLVIASPAGASTTCVGGVVTATPGAASLTVTGATIPARASNGSGANGTCTVTVSVIGASGSYVNTLPAGALTGTETYADNSTHAATSPGPVSASLTYNSALTATKLFAPATVSSGGMSTVSIVLGNVGTGVLNGVGLVDPLPAGMVLANPVSAQTTCGGAPVFTGAPGASSISLSGAILPPSGQCNVLFNVIATGPANWVNTIPAGNITAAGGVRNVTAVAATLINSTTGAVTVTNNAAPNSLTSPGQVSVLTINISNGGTIGLTGLNLTDFFTTTGLAGGAATGMVIAATPAATTNCPGGFATAVPGGGSIQLTGASLAAGASCTVTVNVTLTTTGTVQNTLPVGAVVTTQGISNTLPSTTSLSAGANLGVTKAFLPTVVKPGDRSRLRITLINPLALVVTNLALTDDLPPGVVVPASPNPSTTCAGGTVAAPMPTRVTLAGGSLPAAVGGVSATCLVEIDVVAAAAGAYNNLIAIGGVTGTIGGGGANNPVPAAATLQVRSPVTIAKAFNPTSVGLGASTTATLTLTNPNAIPLTGATLMDNLPANLTVALTPNASTTCAGGVVTAAASATFVRLTGATLPANGACTVTFDALSNVAGTYINTIPAGGLVTDQGVTNENPAAATVRVINPPMVSKQFAPAVIQAGGVSTLTIVLGNINATAATLTAPMVDTLPTSPAAIVVATPNGLGGTCPGAVTAVAGSGTVTYPSGATLPAGGCTIIVNVTGAVEGVFANTIPSGGLQTDQGSNLAPANADLTISTLGYVSGRVFRDNNVTPNGTFEIGVDVPITAISINLTGTDFGANGVAGGGDDTPVNRTTMTDALGNYIFTGLNAGAYSVTEPAQPAGTLNGITSAGTVGGGGGGAPGVATTVAVTPSVVSNITLLRSGGGSVASSPNNNFAEVAVSSLAGSIFMDQDDNGVRNAADTAIAGVTVQLLSGGVVVATTTTDAAGAYQFTGLAPGTYTIREPSQPAGTANGKTLPGAVPNGGTAGAATAQNVTPSAISGLVLPPGSTSSGNDFAEVPAGRQISGRVFLDPNTDGVFNGADTPLSNVMLTLTGTDFNGLPVNQTTVSTADGRYVFTGLAAGTYTVTEPTQPGGSTNGITTAGSTGGVATLVAVTPSAISAINLTGVNTLSSDNDFAEIFAPGAGGGSTSTVTGKVYVDANNNGVPDPSEAPLSGVTVTLSGTSSTGATVLVTTLSGSDGVFTFTGLPPSGPGGYTITETQPSGFSDGQTTTSGSPGTATATKPVPTGGADIITGVVVPASTTLSGYNFGERPAGLISGVVYVDANNDGVRDPGEAGIPGVSVRLTGTDAGGAAVDRTLVTGADGAYSFTGVPASGPGGYTLTETQPATFGDGKTTLPGLPGAAVATKPVAGGGADVISGVVLTTGGQLAGYNFGERTSGLISGVVYVDTNNDGVRDPGEAGIPGVSVRLTGTDASGATVDRTLVTGADGAYSFTGVPASGPGGYTITETQPTTFGDGQTTLPGLPGAAVATKPVAGGGADLITGVVLTTGGQLAGYNFGERPSGLISGVVYVDANNDGVRDPGEAGIPGVTVRLTGTDASGAAVDRTLVTAADGAYSFTGVPASGPGGYTITETQPSTFGDGKTTLPGLPGAAVATKPVAGGGADVVSGVVLTAGGQLAGYNFGERSTLASLAGYVYVDTNNNGVRDPGEGPIADVQVRLTGTDINGGAVSLTRTTGADGGFLFTGLPPSNPAGYTLTEVQPAGFNDGRTSVPTGAPGQTASGKPVGVGDADRVTGVVLTAGTNLTDYRFGELAIPQLKPPIINGYVYFDRAHTRVRPTDGSLEGQPGWTVLLRQNGVVICTTTTDAKGFYQFDNLHCPGYEVSGLPIGAGFSIHFSRNGNTLPAVPTSGDNRGVVPSAGGQILNITLTSADRVVEQNLPLDPAGVIYDAVTREPVAGAAVTIRGPAGFDPGVHLVGGAAAMNQVVGTDGLYQFLLQNNFPSGVYTLVVTAPAGYLPAPSTLLPACAGALNITLIPNPALIQRSDFAPGQGVTQQLNPNTCPGQVPGGSTTTQYFFQFQITNGGSAPILNNHIPLDPILGAAILQVTKITPMVWAARGGLVPYTITATNARNTPLSNIAVRDQLPTGFKYRQGSATRNGQSVQVTVAGGFVTWPVESFAAREKKTYRLLLIVGAGVGDGDYVNRAWAGLTPSNTQISNTAAATVRIAPDPTLDCPDVIGKVFDDRNANGYQDEGEPGIPAVRIATPNGLLVTTDADGRYHVPCPAIPNMDRGSNFVMKLDVRSLPSGFRVTTENPRDVRLTRGKLVKLNFGATVHRVIRVELSGAAFAAGTNDLLPEWRSQLDSLPATLKLRPSVVRITYVAGADPPDLVKQRIADVRKRVRDGWTATKGQYRLEIEIEGEQP